jgi:predicted lactoylglutathione lyase
MDADRGWVLNNISTEEVEAAMRKALERGPVREKPELDQTFHYGNYVKAVDRWLQKLLK